MKHFTQADRFDKLSNLKDQLRRLEPGHFASESNDLRQAREGLIGALSTYTHSRYDLGRALRVYKTCFKAEHAWMAAAKAIAAVIDRDERTVFRMIEDYERTAQLPSITIDAMLDQNIDPTAAKHAEIVENLLRMPEPKTNEEASAVVAGAFKEHGMRKRKKASAKSDLQAFSKRIVKQFEDRYRAAAPQKRDAELQYVLELVVSTLRAPIRELRQFGRPALVPKPTKRGVA